MSVNTENKLIFKPLQIFKISQNASEVSDNITKFINHPTKCHCTEFKQKI